MIEDEAQVVREYDGRQLWGRIWPICRFLEAHDYPADIETRLELLGKKTGRLRKPFALLEVEARMKLRGFLVDAGLEVRG